MSRPLGQPVKITFETFSDAAKTTHADPTVATVYVKDPATGTVASHVWPTGDLTKTATGIFTYTLPDTAAGLYLWRAAATGAVATSTRAGAVSVDEAFPPMLVGLEDAKTGLNKITTTDDDELQTVIYSASAVLLNHPDYRVADVCSVQTFTEWSNSGGDTVELKHYPVTAVTSVTEYTSGTAQVIAAEPVGGGTFTGYGWDYEDGTGANGLLVRLYSGSRVRWGGNRVKVVYTAGSATVPQDVRDAALKLVKHLWRDQRGTGSGRAIPGELPPEEGFLADITPHLLPLEVEQALRPYRRGPMVA